LGNNIVSQRTPVWVVLRCASCHRTYTVNARTAPQWNKRPHCRDCWDRGIRLRATLGLATYECPEGTWPDPTSDDPARNGAQATVLRRKGRPL